MPRYAVMALFAGALGLIIASIIFLYVRKQPNGSERTGELEGLIGAGATTFLKKEFTVLGFIVAVVFLLSGFFIHWNTALSFVGGAVCSLLVGVVGMLVAVKGTSRTAVKAGTSGLAMSLNLGYLAGSVMGLSLAGLGLFSLGVWFWIFGGRPETAIYLNGFIMGASCLAFLARVGGGIFTKAADMGNDLVARVEVGLPENNLRNPGVIAERAGHNVSYIVGMGADIFESYVGSVIAALAIGATLIITPEFGDKFPVLQGLDPEVIRLKLMAAPVLLVIAGLLSSIFGIFSSRLFRKKSPEKAGEKTTFVTTALFAVLTFLVVYGLKMPWGTIGAVFSGLLCGMAIGLLSAYYSSDLPVKKMAVKSTTGSAAVITSGLSLGMKSTCLPILLICTTAFIGYGVAGVYGIGLAAVGMLATVGNTMTVDAYGHIIRNAGPISELAELGPETNKITDSLKALGDKSAPFGRGFAIGSSALTALTLFFAFIGAAGLTAPDLSLTNPQVVIGVLLGGIVPMLGAALIIPSVGEAAHRLVTEIRRQFQEIPGLLEGREGARPDEAACIAIITAAVLKKMIAPGLIMVLTPVTVGLFLGRQSLGGLLIGAIVMGVFLALFMNNGGTVWDHARKWIEKGNLGGKGSDNHRAAVVGDTVGNPLRDASGPAMNILIKLMAVVSLVMAPILPATGILLRF